MNHKIKLLLILFLVALASCQKNEDDIDPTPPPPPAEVVFPRKEMRAVWLATVSNIDWPKNTVSALQKQEYINYLELFKKHNINTVIVQIRPMADAFYNSSLEPWSSYLTGVAGKNPGYDVLQFMIDETHKRGMEFHAWFNPYRISADAAKYKPVSGSFIDRHPEYTMVYDNLLLFRPGVPEVQTHFLAVVQDVLDKYNVDGVHLDDYFYPYPVTGVSIDDAADYQKYGSSYNTIEAFRRGSVDKVIEGVNNLLKTKRPDVVFSVSPFSVYSYNYDYLFADITLWCKNKWVDCIMPQLYASSQSSYGNFVDQLSWWSKNNSGVPLVIGHALYKFGDSSASSEVQFQSTAELDVQMTRMRANTVTQGSAWYNASAVKNNKIRVVDALDKYYNTPALIPFMGRKTQPDPADVANLRVTQGLLEWNSAGENIRYAVYQLDTEEKNATLVAVVDTPSYQLTQSGKYIVSALNVDNVEGKPSNRITYNK